jgi:hypothetical protein
LESRFSQFQQIAIATDRYASEGAARGSVGFILEIYDDGALEIEIPDRATGHTIALITAWPSEIQADDSSPDSLGEQPPGDRV